MKSILLALLLATAATALLLAQGRVIMPNHLLLSSNPITYGPRFPPPVSLPEGYALSLHYLGTATNSLHCIAASALERTNSRLAGWTFTFSTTNNQRTGVVVFYDKRACLEPLTYDSIPK